jgi:hypothetical protein
MQLKVFVLPVKNLGATEAEMNAFLRGHRVLAVKKEFVADGENSFWSFCVEYLDGMATGALGAGGRPPKVDYREVLKPEEFEVFSRLRDWRKGVAGEGRRARVYDLHERATRADGAEESQQQDRFEGDRRRG